MGRHNDGVCRIALNSLCCVCLLGLLTSGCTGPRYGSHEATPPPGQHIGAEPEPAPAIGPTMGSQESEEELTYARQQETPPPLRAPDLGAPPVTTTQAAPVRTTVASQITNSASVPTLATFKGPWVSSGLWSRVNGMGPLQRVSMGDDPSFEFATPRGRFLFQVQNRQAMWTGIQVYLGFEPQMVGGEPCLHELDLKKNLNPLLLSGPWSAYTGGVLVLDPGHGGVQSGTRSVLDGSLEKSYTLDWALRLRPLLEQGGWRVLLTRTNDSELSLSNRVIFANNAKADLFVSLHFNAAGGGTHQAGLETYCLTPTGMPSTLTRGYADDPAEVLPNNAFDDENVRLAAALHRSILAVNGGLDRGLRRARFMTVLRGPECPAVLIEGGFLSNPDEAARIADPMFRQQLAEAVARALMPRAQPAGS